MTQAFKENDELEARVKAVAAGLLAAISADLDAFYNGAFTAYPLGDMLYLLDRDPMVGVILPETYRASFPAIHELFTKPATFDFYLSVFYAIWGTDSAITFSRPTPGVLNIDIQALDLQESIFLARRIENNTYIYDEVVTQDGDYIVFQTTQGIKSQREADALINEISAAGLVTNLSLTIA